MLIKKLHLETSNGIITLEGIDMELESIPVTLFNRDNPDGLEVIRDKISIFITDERLTKVKSALVEGYGGNKLKVQIDISYISDFGVELIAYDKHRIVK